MKGIVFSMILATGFIDPQQPPTAYSEPGGQIYVQESARSTHQSYVYVYGRKSCGNTARMMAFLKKERIPYQFYSVDDQATANDLHDKMRSAGLNTRSYYLPVVEVNGRIASNPKLESVRSIYNN